MRITEVRWGLVLLCKQRQKYEKEYNSGREDKKPETHPDMKRGTEYTQGSEVEGTISGKDG
jgi:hypothetical protein